MLLVRSCIICFSVTSSLLLLSLCFPSYSHYYFVRFILAHSLLFSMRLRDNSVDEVQLYYYYYFEHNF